MDGPAVRNGNWCPELVEHNQVLRIGVSQLAPCGFDLERSLQEQAVLERYPCWCELQAVRQGNVVFADGNLLFNRSGMTVSQTAEVIAEILHGVSFGETTERVRWRRIETHAKVDSQQVTMSRA
jgi:iron complex transport system substrate-binding protein